MNTLHELYTEAARVAKMIEGTDLIMLDVVRVSGCRVKEYLVFKAPPECYTFASAIVEDKPVFAGDILYDKQGGKITIEGHEHLNWKYFSWNPPKPKTVMIELTREDAEYIVTHGWSGVRVASACREALKKEQ